MALNNVMNMSKTYEIQIYVTWQISIPLDSRGGVSHLRSLASSRWVRIFFLVFYVLALALLNFYLKKKLLRDSIHASDLKNPKVASILMSIFENMQNDVMFSFPLHMGF
jgi:hypothetical protein